MFSIRISNPIKRASLVLTMGLLAALQSACATRPDIRLDRDPAVDLRQFKTFAFYEPAGPGRQQYSTLLNTRLKEATREQLLKHNYVYSESYPDMRVHIVLHVVDRKDVRTASGRAGVFAYSRFGKVETVDYRQGTLLIDLVDARRNALVWRGVAEGRVSDEAVKNPGPAIDTVVSEIFANYPDSRVN